MYTLVAVLSLVATAAFVRRRPVVLVVALTLLLYTHTWGVFLFAGFAVVALAARWRWARSRCVAALYLPWVPSLVVPGRCTPARRGRPALGPLPRARGRSPWPGARATSSCSPARRGSPSPGWPRSSSPRGRRGTCSCSSAPCCSCSRAGPRGRSAPSAGRHGARRPGGRQEQRAGRRGQRRAERAARRSGGLSPSPSRCPVLHRYLPAGVEYLTPLGHARRPVADRLARRPPAAPRARAERVLLPGARARPSRRARHARRPPAAVAVGPCRPSPDA